MLCDAMIDRPKKKASRLVTFGEVLYSLSPATVDIILHQAYDLFPDSKAAKEPKGADGDGRPQAPAAPKDEEMSAEAVAMAYLMRGVHF